MTLPKSSTGDCLTSARRLRFVLVETSRAGNVGAAARAIKTMGFSALVLVRPKDPDVRQAPEAIAFASGAQDILQAARIVETIGEALEGCNYTAAVSARLREFSPPVLTPRALAVTLAAHHADARTLHPALVFGNERAGLPNDIVQMCNVLINIPANPAYSSLNLAQAVQILAYECGTETMAGPAQSETVRDDLATAAQVEAMYAHLEQALVHIAFLDPDNPRRLMARLRSLFARTGLETEEVNILRGIARQMQKTHTT